MIYHVEAFWTIAISAEVEADSQAAADALAEAMVKPELPETCDGWHIDIDADLGEMTVTPEDEDEEDDGLVWQTPPDPSLSANYRRRVRLAKAVAAVDEVLTGRNTDQAAHPEIAKAFAEALAELPGYHRPTNQGERDDD